MTMDALAIPARYATPTGGTKEEADDQPRRESGGKPATDSSKEVGSQVAVGGSNGDAAHQVTGKLCICDRSREGECRACESRHQSGNNGRCIN
jgi:hypothetical protein